MISVLIVEDDPMVAHFNRSYLEQVDGYCCIGTASSVAEAEILLECERPQLILLDLFMRTKDGFDLLNQIRSSDANIDVIVISAARDPERIKKALQYGAVDYLIKPFHFPRFKAALDHYRETYHRMIAPASMSQDDLDQLIRRSPEEGKAQSLPKGLTPGTLKIVWEAIEGHRGSFSTEDASRLSGISRVSVRKYLSFLLEIGVLQTEMIYGTGGRPLDIFHALPDKSKIVAMYI
ncbi:response regulator [Paenibacillus woosongensis]|uniref:Transcriptional regulatory protein n=1 Tax=Paenibacillus woosongensis TaxID=307580 RepID=A0AA95L056_9BACL|nr:response regulator [Paenibacillus woosongensis]WHX47739.1 response regulator [Paenibacillus woosongensis]